MLLQVIAFTGLSAHLVTHEAAQQAAAGNLVVARASLSIPDTLFLFVVALVVFGPKRLPEIGKQIGKLVGEFRRASNDFKLQIEDELRASEQQDRLKALETKAAAEPPPDTTIDAPRPVDSLPAPEPPDRSEKSNPRLMLQRPASGAPVSALPPNHTAMNADVLSIPPASAPPEAVAAAPEAESEVPSPLEAEAPHG